MSRFVKYLSARLTSWNNTARFRRTTHPILTNDSAELGVHHSRELRGRSDIEGAHAIIVLTYVESDCQMKPYEIRLSAPHV